MQSQCWRRCSDRSLRAAIAASAKEIEQNVVTYGALLGSSKSWPFSVQLLARMRQRQLRPDVRSYSDVIRASKAHWEVALQVFEVMNEVGEVLEDPLLTPRTCAHPT